MPSWASAAGRYMPEGLARHAPLQVPPSFSAAFARAGGLRLLLFAPSCATLGAEPIGFLVWHHHIAFAPLVPCIHLQGVAHLASRA